MAFEPLRIESAMLSPVAGDSTLPIDGILMALAAAREYGQLTSLRPGEVLDVDPDIVPIQRLHEGNDWFFAASFAIWGDNVEQPEYWTKRFNASDAAWTPPKNVNVSGGFYKARRELLPTRFAERIVWYVVGDATRIKALLEDCHDIGKKRAQGFGAVRKWRVERAAHDYSVISEDGNVARAIPQSWGRPRELIGRPLLASRAIRPPYWAQEHVRLAYVPTVNLYDVEG